MTVSPTKAFRAASRQENSFRSHLYLDLLLNSAFNSCVCVCSVPLPSSLSIFFPTAYTFWSFLHLAQGRISKGLSGA